MTLSPEAVAGHFDRLLNKSVLDKRLDPDVRTAVERWLRGSATTRVRALFLIAALETGAISRVASVDAVRVTKLADDQVTWTSAPVLGEADATLAELSWEDSRLTLLFRDRIRKDEAQLEATLVAAMESYATPIYERANALPAKASEDSSDWLCALACAACTLFNQACDACQLCSGLPEHV